MLLCGLCGYESRKEWSLGALPVIWAAAVIAEWRDPQTVWRDVLFVGGYMTIAWAGGRLVRGPVRQARSAEERALRLEREQEAAAERAVQDERRRIARELHDIVAHSVSVMTVQAGAVRRLLLPDQQRERDAMVSIEQTGRDALAEMRRLVGLLKDESGPAYAPQPGLAALGGLVTTMAEAGLPVDVTIEGEPHALTPGMDLTAYRLVQEALTNALKYAGPAEACVAIRWSPAELLIEVANNGRAASQSSAAGFGQAGMRERLELYGGKLESGPRPDGGYVVRGHLPLGAAT
jgi:signal transduction histidine kinase